MSPKPPAGTQTRSRAGTFSDPKDAIPPAGPSVNTPPAAPATDALEAVFRSLLSDFRKDPEDALLAIRAERDDFRKELAQWALDIAGSSQAPPAAPSSPPTEEEFVRDRPPHLPAPVPSAPASTPTIAVTCNSRPPIWTFDFKPFSGKSSDVQSHLSTCELAFKSEPTPLSDEQKILVSLKQCRDGAAKTWHDTCVDSLVSGSWASRTWDEYKSSFVVTFGDPFLASQGQRDMDAAFQRPGESASQFFLRFDRYRSSAGMTDPAFDASTITTLRLRMNPAIVKKVKLDLRCYETFKKEMIIADGTLREQDRAKDHYSTLSANAPSQAASSQRRPFMSRWTGSSATSSSAPSSSPIAAPAPVPASSVPQPRNPETVPFTAPSAAGASITAAPWRGTCFNCGQRDHKKADCPHPAKTGRIAMILEQAAEALVQSGNEDCAANLVEALQEVEVEDFGNGEL